MGSFVKLKSTDERASSNSGGSPDVAEKKSGGKFVRIGTPTVKKSYGTGPALEQEVVHFPATAQPRDATWGDALLGSLKRGYYNSLYGEETFSKMMGEENEAEKYAKLLAGDEYNFEADGWLRKAVSGAAELLGQQARQFTNPDTLNAALLGAGTFAGGALALGQAGPQIATPEEVITVPAAALAGLKAGFTAGSATSNLEIEAGHAYNEMIQQGISEEMARNIALGVGGINAALEFVQVDELLKSFKVLNKSGASDTVLKRIADELAARGIDVAKETAQEVAQEGVTIGGSQLASKMETGDWAYNTDEVLERLGDTAASSALSFGVMNVPGGVSNVYASTRKPATQAPTASAAPAPAATEQTTTLPGTPANATLRRAAEQMAQEGRVSGKSADRILADREALSELTGASGLQLTDAMTAKQRRAAVKSAVERLASRVDERSSAAAEITPPPSPRMRNVAQTDNASVFGENGQAAYRLGLERGDLSEETYYAEFARAYNAGLNDGPLAAANIRHLTQEQAQTAFVAGQSDAAITLEKEKAAAPFAKVYGSDAGLVADDYVMANLDNEAITTLNSVAKLLGTRVRFVDSVDGGQANASILNGEILIDKNSDRPVRLLLGHEWTHRLQELAPEEYNRFRTAVAEDPEIAGAVQETIRRYQEHDKTISYEAALDEVVSDYAGHMVEDSDVLERFIERHRDDRTLLEKVRDAIRDLVRKLTGAEKRMAQTAEGRLTAALEAAVGQVEENRVDNKKSASEGGAERYSLKDKIAVGMDDQQRYELLKDKQLVVPKVDDGKVSEIKAEDFAALENIGRDRAYKILREIGNQFRVFKDYKNMDLEIEFAFSRGNMRESVFKQGGEYQNYARLLTVFDDVVENAVGIEAHKNRYEYKGSQVKETYVFTGAFEAGADVVPVLLEVREFTDGTKSTLYITASLTAIKKNRIVAHNNADISASEPYALPALNIKIADLFANVNPADKRLLKYIPDGFLNDAQQAAKQEAIAEQEEYVTGKNAKRQESPVDHTSGKPRFSIKTDSQGRELTEEQREYFRDSKAVDGRGRLLTLYHQTEGLFTVFDPRHQGAGSRDNATPFGIFLKTSDRDIGLKGKFQMELYANITNPLYASNREALTYSLLKLSDEYATIKAEIDTLDATYHEKFEQAKQKLRDFMTEWRNKNPGASRRALYDVPEFNALYEAEDAVVEEWTQKADQLSAQAKNAITAALRNAGYDGVILSTDAGSFGRSTDAYIALDPEQVKNASNKKPTSDPDIRFSLKGTENVREVARLTEENELLRERVEFWKGQTRRTQRVTTDKKAVAAAARELLRSYGADLTPDEITGDLQSLYDYIASGYDGSDELTYTEARRRASAIAEKLVESAVATDDEYYQAYADLRNYLRTTKLRVPREMWADLESTGGYNEFRRANMGRMQMSATEGVGIDQVYRELSEMAPEFFDETREVAPADQLLHIAEVLDGIYAVSEYNPFSQYFQQAVTDASNEIMERFFDLPQTRKTFADRQAQKLAEEKAKGIQKVQEVREKNNARLDELRKQNRQKVQDAIIKERQRREKSLEQLRNRYREKDAAGRERRSARELRAKIIRHAKALSKKLLRPTDKQHIPESLRVATAALLDAINLESDYTLDPATLHQVQRKDGKPGGMTGKRLKDGTGTPTKRTEAFRQLRLAYADITKDGQNYDLIIDPDLMGNLTDLEKLRDIPLSGLNKEQLETMWATIRAVERSITSANQMLGKSRFATISSFAEGIKSDNAGRKDRGDYRDILGKVDKLVNLDMLTPQAYFHRLGKTAEELFRMMRSAQDRHISIMRDAQLATKKIVGNTDITKLEQETHTFDIGGGEQLTMSTAQIMSLYELLKRQQAQKHILIGGIRPDTIPTKKGIKESRRAEPVHVTMGDLADIFNVLTDEQIQVADSLQKYMGGKLAELGNEASMAVYGYRKFNEKDYFPIKVDQSQTKKDDAKQAQAATIAGRGFTRGVEPNASNAVMLQSIFDVYASHVNDMATYAAWLPTMENIRRIRDFAFWDKQGTRTGDIKSIIERVFGKNGNAYLDKLIADINQGVRANATGNLTDGLIGNYKAASVAANIRVVLQQPTAILRALDSLDPKYLAKGAVKSGDWEKVMKYAPIARWKDWGYFDINTGRQMKDVLLDSDSKLEKVKQLGMEPAGKMDSFAWARLWNAVEAELKDTRPGLKPGTEAFYQAVAERFTEIVDRTQVVDGLLQRSQIMRNTDGLSKMSTSFMGEPTKTYNMFMSAAYDVMNAPAGAAKRTAKQRLARTTTALVASFVVNAVMQSLVDALRDDDKERYYWEKFLSAYTGFTGDEETFEDHWNSFWDGNLQANFNPLGYLPYFKDLVSIARGYDVSRMDMEPVSKVVESANNMKKALNGEGKYTRVGAFSNLLAESARLLGVPVANLKRDILAALTTAAIETDNYLMQYRIDKALLNMSTNAPNFMDILYNAYINDPKAYKIIYADIVAEDRLATATMTTEQRIANGMESRMKKGQGVESVKDLETRFLSPAQEKAYESHHKAAERSRVWKSASEIQRQAFDEALHALVTGSSEGMKLKEKAAAGAAHGVSETDYILYQLAKDVVSQDGNSNTSQAEAEAAAAMLTGVNDRARAYLWQSTNSGWSKENNPFK